MIERRTRDYLLNKQIIQASSRQRKWMGWVWTKGINLTFD
jgi:hypothetical protein